MVNIFKEFAMILSVIEPYCLRDLTKRVRTVANFIEFNLFSFSVEADF
jgi:hypothetical protein